MSQQENVVGVQKNDRGNRRDLETPDLSKFSALNNLPGIGDILCRAVFVAVTYQSSSASHLVVASPMPR